MALIDHFHVLIAVSNSGCIRGRNSRFLVMAAGQIRITGKPQATANIFVPPGLIFAA